MGIWIFIWAVLSAFVLGVFAWSLRILFQQKAAWRAYAEKMKLTYANGPRFLSSPNLSGAIGAYGFGLYTEEQKSDDARNQRFSTILEIALRRGLPAIGAMGTIRVVPLIHTLHLPQSMVPEDKEWDPSWMVRGRNAAMIRAYLTPARMEIIKKIFRMKILSALLVFDEQDMVLRIETADPLNNKDRLEKIVKGLIQQAEGLIVQEAEWHQLAAVMQAAPGFIPAPEAPVVEEPAKAPVQTDVAVEPPQTPEAGPDSK